MAWSFRKRIKIAPGVHINLSKSGVSTSLGPKGAKVTVGPKGTYLHTSIPGTGLYSRKKISNGTTGESSSSSLSNISFDHSDGSVFSGCLLSWPRFFIWVGIILLSLYDVFRSKNI